MFRKTENNIRDEKAVKNRSKIKYGWVRHISKIMFPICTALFYIFIITAVILAICAAILPIINVPVLDMLMPPFMHAVKEGSEIVGYDIYVGNGIRMYMETELLRLADIKTVYYTAIAAVCGILLTAAPIMKFSALFLRNISAGDGYNEKNPKYIDYIGRVVFIGNTIVLFLERFYNYYLVKLFVADGSNISLSLGINFSGMMLGIMIMFFGYIYGYLCAIHNNSTERDLTATNDLSDKE